MSRNNKPGNRIVLADLESNLRDQSTRNPDGKTVDRSGERNIDDMVEIGGPGFIVGVAGGKVFHTRLFQNQVAPLGKVGQELGGSVLGGLEERRVFALVGGRAETEVHLVGDSLGGRGVRKILGRVGVGP